mmetsp:Transcript_15150/g.39123  ORF Transcript_15150/g.39123 Transcript_15150/m.39123 type:complete len:98 (+) Transcript_15150:486-779(+)
MYPAVTHFISQHSTLAERREAALRLRDVLQAEHGLSIPLCVDLMDNALSVAFGALPERLVILRDGVVEWIGGKGPEDYSVGEMRAALDVLLPLKEST